jgi:hypothetical protein
MNFRFYLVFQIKKNAQNFIIKAFTYFTVIEMKL